MSDASPLPKPASSSRAGPLSGTVRAPGDKSISHRSLIFGAMAEGTTTVSGLLEGADILSTASALRAFGIKIEADADGIWHIEGRAKWDAQPRRDIDCGNAGTGVRLLMGAAAGYDTQATFTGDASLSSRPMARITDPLSQMGASFAFSDKDFLPITLTSNGVLTPIEYTSPKASAQIKSAVLLAGVNTQGETAVIEKPSRDHTENMLRAFGCPVEVRAVGGGKNRISIKIDMTDAPVLKATHINVPGDPSSAAFAVVAALIVPGSDIIVENVMMNPTRTGLFDTLAEMGGHVRADNFRTSGGEVIADLHVKSSKLQGITVPPERAASMIDEYPVLAVAAANAKGTTVMDGIGELRVKESDRISATHALLSANGVQAEELPEGLRVTGGAVAGGGTVATHHDHRIAMSALVLGLVAEKPVAVDDTAMIATSFPTFFALMDSLGATIKLEPSS